MARVIATLFLLAHAIVIAGCSLPAKPVGSRQSVASGRPPAPASPVAVTGATVSGVYDAARVSVQPNSVVLGKAIGRLEGSRLAARVYQNLARDDMLPPEVRGITIELNDGYQAPPYALVTAHGPEADPEEVAPKVWATDLIGRSLTAKDIDDFADRITNDRGVRRAIVQCTIQSFRGRPLPIDRHLWWAVVAGVSADDNAAAADKDAIEIRDLLVGIGVPARHVKLHINGGGPGADPADHDGLAVNTMGDWLLAGTPARDQPASLVWFFWSGHGIPDQQGNRVGLLLFKANAKNFASLYAIDEIIRDIDDKNAGWMIVMLDSCYSGAISHERPQFSGGMYFAAASAAKRTNPDPLKHGYLTSAVLEAFDRKSSVRHNADDSISLGALAEWIPKRVRALEQAHGDETADPDAQTFDAWGQLGKLMLRKRLSQ